MNYIKNKIANWFGRSKKTSAEPEQNQESLEKAFLVFQHTGDVLQAEKLLQNANFACTIMAPPDNLRTGCDMVIVFDLVLEPAIIALLLKNNIIPEQTLNVQDGMLDPVSLFQTKDFGDWFMVRAANMKITIEKSSGKIVNISGGGCPDVPYLASIMMNQKINQVEEPRIQGQTLCSFSLQKAFEEARRQWNG